MDGMVGKQSSQPALSQCETALTSRPVLANQVSRSLSLSVMRSTASVVCMSVIVSIPIMYRSGTTETRVLEPGRIIPSWNSRDTATHPSSSSGTFSSGSSPQRFSMQHPLQKLSFPSVQIGNRGFPQKNIGCTSASSAKLNSPSTGSPFASPQVMSFTSLKVRRTGSTTAGIRRYDFS